MNFLKLFFYKPFLGVNITQFFDTFCNNFLRNAITAAVIFGVIDVKDNTTISSLMVGILMLPSFLFMATAGEIVDKYPKDLVIKIVKIIQLFATIIACIGFTYNNIWVLLIALFLMGTFATFLSTAKYSILPDILPKNNLLAANGLLQMMVFLAILSGTILGGMFFSDKSCALYIILITSSIIGVISAFAIPRQISISKNSLICKNLITALIKNISFLSNYKEIIFYIISISWFWFIGTVIISLIPTFTKEIINGDNSVFTLFIILFTIGVSIGTILCQNMLKGKISNKFILPCLSIIVFILIDLAYISATYNHNENTITLKILTTKWQGVHIILDMLIFSIIGGIYIVPLTTTLQILAPNNARAKIIASNNIINALFMIIGSCFCAFSLWIKIIIPIIFVILSGLNIIFIIIYIIQRTSNLGDKYDC